jgi:ankyrin repeat protein
MWFINNKKHATISVTTIKYVNNMSKSTKSRIDTKTEKSQELNKLKDEFLLKHKNELDDFQESINKNFTPEGRWSIRETDPFILAARFGDTESIDLFLKNGYDKNVRGPHGFTALFECKTTESMPMLQHLLKSGVDINAKDAYGSTVLMRACETRNIECIKNLLDDPKIDINAKDPQGNTALDRILPTTSQDLQQEIKGLFAAKAVKRNMRPIER